MNKTAPSSLRTPGTTATPVQRTAHAGRWIPTFVGMTSALLAALVLVLGGCASPDFEPTAPPATPAAFKSIDGRWAALPPAEAQARGEWWKAFTDPLLDDLVARADRSNTSIQLAAARLAQARALVRATDAERLPQVDAAASVARQTLPLASGALPDRWRTTGLAVVAAVIALGRFVASAGFGALWQRYGDDTAATVYLVGALIAAVIGFVLIRREDSGSPGRDPGERSIGPPGRRTAGTGRSGQLEAA